MSRRAMTAFLDALTDDPAIARGVETALTQPEDRTVVWAVARYARSLGYAVEVTDVDRERARRLGQGQRAAGKRAVGKRGAGQAAAPLYLVQT